MSAMPPRRIAVLDIGKTNVKAVLFDGESGEDVATRTMPNSVLGDGPYPHYDIARIEAFVLDALADLVALEGGFEAVSITAHGASGALIDGQGLAMPVLDYEHDGPDKVAAAYDAVRPGFDETFSPRLPGGLNLGAQLFWQATAFPDAFAAAEAIVTYPQYWAFWLSGVAATEATSLGAHTDLWAPRAGRFSSLVGRLGWTGKMAPLRSAFDTLGMLRPDLARRIGLDRPVPVACGLHDSNASLLPHLQTETGAFSVVSTGTWVICFALGGALDRLDPDRDTLANVDAYGRPVPSARFMGGREFDILTAHAPTAVDQAAIDAILSRGVMALPTFVAGCGPFPRGQGRWTHDPDALSPGERTAVASLYEALMTATSLDLLKAAGRTIVEGPFARNALYGEALAQLTGRPVTGAQGATGTSAGAARLLRPAMSAAKPTEPAAARYTLGPALDAYARLWRAAADRGG